MKNIRQKILGLFKDKKDPPQSEEKEVLTDEIIQKFISNPETFTLARTPKFAHQSCIIYQLS